GVVDCLREIALPFESRRHSHKDRVGRSDRMRLLERKEKEQPVFLFVGEDLWYLDWPADVESPDVVTIERPWQARLIGEKRSAVWRFIANEVVCDASIIFAAALSDQVDHGAAVIAVFRRVVIAQDFNLGNRVLVDSHAQFV